LNCTVGLTYGITTIGYMGSKAIHFFYKAVAFVISKIFDRKNVTGPLGAISKATLGTNVMKKPSELAKVNNQIME